MRKGLKRYDNKKNYDPGRLNHEIKFYKLTTVNDGFGGVTTTETLDVTTKCAKVSVSENSISMANQIGLIGDATEFVEVWYFVVRVRKGWVPTKSMTVEVGGVKYVINGISPLSDPVTYYRLLCSR